MKDVDVAIVGGGVAGGAAACALGSAGLRTVLFERRDLARDPNRGDALEPESLKLLHHFGAREPLERRGAVWVRRGSLQAVDSAEVIAFELAENSRLVLNHAEIEAGLLERAEACGVERHNQAVESIRHEGPRWALTAGALQVRARLLVGADGARSGVREAMGIGVTRHDYDHSILILHARRPAWLEEDAAWLLLHPEGGVQVFPTTPRGRCRVVTSVWRAEAAAWMSASEEQLRRRLGQRHPLLGMLEVERRGGSHVYHVSRQHASRYVEDGAALIGDAAHVTHPMGGWGMNLAIRDAVKLAEVATPWLQGSRGPLTRAMLAEYERRQRPANERTMRIAHWRSRLLTPTWIEHRLARALILGGARVQRSRVRRYLKSKRR